MHAKVVAIDIGTDGHSLEAFDELLVYFLIVVEFLQDFLSECKVLGHGSRLVIAAEHDHITGEVELEKIGVQKLVGFR